MWQNIRFTPEEEAAMDELDERVAAAGGLFNLPWTAEDQAAADAWWAELRAENEAAYRAWDRPAEAEHQRGRHTWRRSSSAHTRCSSAAPARHSRRRVR
jgi:hypothetical protein